ncbi:MAG: hypothetical protein RL660_754 [Bacteroidota bacterium]
MKSVLSFLLILFAQVCFAQMKFGVNINFNADTLKVRHYDAPRTMKHTSTILLPFKFNETNLTSRKYLDTLNDGLTQVLSIDYVYTEYKDRKTQEDINAKRIMELSLAAPNLLNQGMTKWRFIEQLGFTKDEDARNLFHGFVITYKRDRPMSIASVSEAKAQLLATMKEPNDSLFTSVFTRNPQFTKELVVADFTCSMTPYYMDMMAWFCLHEFTREIPFAFFNDGDGKPNDQKVIGQTGGVHQFKTNSLDTLANYVYETTKTGCSGDCPENDIEAILKAIEKNPKVKEVILIADNWSDMRDYNLRGLITKPVHIILCGTEYGINPQYLNLAYITKGSIHTMKEDLHNLFKFNEGKVFTLNGQEFVVRQGRIDKVKKI